MPAPASSDSGSQVGSKQRPGGFPVSTHRTAPVSPPPGLGRWRPLRSAERRKAASRALARGYGQRRDLRDVYGPAEGYALPMASRRAIRIAENQAMFRVVNERVSAWPERRAHPATG